MKKKEISNFSIFGEYDTRENRVTAALLHIMKMGGEPLINSILGARNDSLPESEVVVETQSKKESSVPDGELSCNFQFHIYIESKITTTDINEKQMNKHCELIKDETDKLIYVTPHSVRPKILQEPIIWFNWKEIIDLLNAYEGKSDLLTYLVEQFQLMIENFDLVNYADKRVIVVGGAWGEDVALKYGIYACQPKRSFWTAKYITFCHKNQIKNLFEIIEGPIKNVDLRTVDYIKESNYFDFDKEYKGTRKLFKLKHIKTFNPAIKNDKTDKNGKRTAFTQKQCYTTYDKIIEAKFTSEL